jgi:hypothetical protein
MPHATSSCCLPPDGLHTPVVCSKAKKKREPKWKPLHPESASQHNQCNNSVKLQTAYFYQLQRGLPKTMNYKILCNTHRGWVTALHKHHGQYMISQERSWGKQTNGSRNVYPNQIKTFPFTEYSLMCSSQHSQPSDSSRVQQIKSS